MAKNKIVVIGASAGGVTALQQLVAALPQDFPAAVLIVLHVGVQSPSLLPEILTRAGALPAAHPEDGDAIEPGHIYVSPQDNHLVIQNGHLGVIRGPKENRHRPSVDVLFRSAARAYGNHVIAVVLTGTLDDGAAGMLAIQHRGGTTVVQTPADAMYPNMPNAVLRSMTPDYVVALREMGALLVKLVRAAPLHAELPKTALLKKDTNIVEMNMETMADDDKPGKPSAFACPECHGVLWEITDGKLLRFRCRVGHAYSSESMEQAHGESVEATLWAALRSLEESAALSRRLAARDHSKLAARYHDTADTKERQVDIMKTLILGMSPEKARRKRGRAPRAQKSA